MEYTAIITIDNWYPMGVRVGPEGLLAVLWGREAERLVAGASGEGDNVIAKALRCAASQWLAHLREYFAGSRREFPLEIAWGALPPFQRVVLQAVAAIPYGETRAYGQIAAAIGRPKAARAVGRAVATNPMPIVVPCHRVVGSNGALHGYSGPGGLATKARLLALEGNREYPQIAQIGTD